LPERALFPSRSFSAFLFDMDGTILTSIEAAERVWRVWGARHGLDVEALLPTIHGKRVIETVRQLGLPGIDPAFEAAEITRMEMDDVDGIRPIPGAADFLRALPKERWAIVTSAPKLLAQRRLEAAGLPQPPMMVSSEDVTNGKPAPDCFLLAASRFGRPATDCLVFEDAPAGITAAEAAAAAVVVVTATHASEQPTLHPTIDDYGALELRQTADGGLELFRAP